MTEQGKAPAARPEDLLLPHDGSCPDWVEHCRGHIDNFAADPSKWGICLGCAFAAIREAIRLARFGPWPIEASQSEPPKAPQKALEVPEIPAIPDSKG